MEKIVIRVKDRQKAQALKSFLQTLDFVESIAEPETDMAKKNRRGKKSDFFSLAGIWAGRETSLEAIRQKAWPKRL